MLEIKSNTKSLPFCFLLLPVLLDSISILSTYEHLKYHAKDRYNIAFIKTFCVNGYNSAREKDPYIPTNQIA